MAQENSNKKTLAKNTVFLYARMLLTMFVGLFTSRVVLQTLGVVDYGIYNVVGGIITMLSFIDSTMTGSTQRFITYEIGRGNLSSVKNVFYTSNTVHLILSLTIFLISETVGLWFVNTCLNIPADRMFAANCIYQCTIFSFVTSTLMTPFNAAIVAHERLDAYAYISIFDVLAKLGVVYLLVVFSFDKLILYAILLATVALLSKLITLTYAMCKFPECRLKYKFSVAKVKEMTGFAGWNLIGTLAWIAKDQGINVLINIFCGPAINAARGIAFQVNGAVSGFVNNFQTALNPQITKSYAVGDLQTTNKLVIKGTVFSYYLLFLLSLPVFVNTEYLLGLWLKEVPAYAVVFVRLSLIGTLVDLLYRCMLIAHLATGNIKLLQIYAGLVNMLNLPISFLFLYMGADATCTFIIAIIISFVNLFVRVYCYKKVVPFNAADFVKNVMFRSLYVSFISAIVPFALKSQLSDNFFTMFFTSCVSLACTILTIRYIGLTKGELVQIKGYAQKLADKIFKRPNHV